jgi:hypothetical protein
MGLISIAVRLAMASMLIAGIPAAFAQPAGPPADYKLDPDFSESSSDGATRIEQYAKPSADDGLNWQIWVRRKDGSSLLQPAETDYPASFRFTHDGRWLVRSQKTGAGENSLYLYVLRSEGFVDATAKPLGDMAWAYFHGLPESRRIKQPDFHISAGLLKGADENYRWMGVDWPDSRYLVISLSGDVLPSRRHGQILSVQGWRCRYDLQTGAFEVPPDFRSDNAKALRPISSRR